MANDLPVEGTRWVFKDVDCYFIMRGGEICVADSDGRLVRALIPHSLLENDPSLTRIDPPTNPVSPWMPASSPPDTDRLVLLAHRDGSSTPFYCTGSRLIGGEWVDGKDVEISAPMLWMDIPKLPQAEGE